MDIIFSTPSGDIKLRKNLSSQRLFNLRIKCFLSIVIRLSKIQNGNDAYDDIIESLETIFELVNDDGGLTITAQSRCGLINDAALISSNNT